MSVGFPELVLSGPVPVNVSLSNFERKKMPPEQSNLKNPQTVFIITDNFLAEGNLYSCDHAVIAICHGLIFTFLTNLKSINYTTYKLRTKRCVGL